ncbi:MAG TPA: head maturation protease, ClpP-related [Steroidobacteraceae bacterium]|nr:head maturation protease, ClpP-related [Steroidobacteraceae bacterium]
MNRLSQLVARNRSRPRRYEVRHQAGSESATVYLYDMIDPDFGIGADQFVKDLNAISAPRIDLHINSPGGDVFDGRAIASAIAAHPSNVVAHIDGLAASAASTVAMAADEVEMAPGSFLMIHRAWTLAFGNAEDLQETAALLEKIDGSLAADYVAQTGNSLEQVTDWMNAETWFTADEALANGFADRIAGDTDDDDDEDGQSDDDDDGDGIDPASAAANWDLTAYLKRPPARAAAKAPPVAAQAQDDNEGFEAAADQRRRELALI